MLGQPGMACSICTCMEYVKRYGYAIYSCPRLYIGCILADAIDAELSEKSLARVARPPIPITAARWIENICVDGKA